MDYSFIISTSIKQVKGLELILSVPFVFGSCCCEPHHVVKGSLHTRETDDCLASKTKLHQRERAGTLGAKSTVWFILRKQDRTGELRNIERPGRPRRTTVVMIGESSPW